MFITDGQATYNKNGEQRAQGKFLIVFDHPDDKVYNKKRPLRCIVKTVKLTQCGHWMMGTWKHDGYTLTLSGTYGGDGLPVTTAGSDEKKAFVRKIWDQLTPMPDDIVSLFWNDNGHNSCGVNGPAIAKWAKDNIVELSKLKKPVT